MSGLNKTLVGWLYNSYSVIAHTWEAMSVLHNHNNKLQAKNKKAWYIQNILHTYKYYYEYINKFTYLQNKTLTNEQIYTPYKIIYTLIKYFTHSQKTLPTHKIFYQLTK